jgi:hypothetical protein
LKKSSIILILNGMDFLKSGEDAYLKAFAYDLHGYIQE